MSAIENLLYTQEQVGDFCKKFQLFFSESKNYRINRKAWEEFCKYILENQGSLCVARFHTRIREVIVEKNQEYLSTAKDFPEDNPQYPRCLSVML